MRLIVRQFSGLFFWGVLYTLVLVLGFKVNLADIISESVTSDMPLNYYCIFLLVSFVIIFLRIVESVRAIYSGKKQNFYAPVTLELISLLDNFIYQPIYIVESIKEIPEWKETKELCGGIGHEIVLFIMRFTTMLLWWIILFAGIYGITSTEGNRLLVKMKEASRETIFFIATAVAIILITCISVDVLMNTILERRLEDNSQKRR